VAVQPVTGSDAAGRSVSLSRGQRGTLDAAGAVAVVDSVDVDAARGWMSGQLVFAERPLRDVVVELERWYDVDIAVDNAKLLAVPVTATFTTGLPVDDALTILSGTLSVRYTREGRMVRLVSPSRHP
jgi:transmembrane sensor